MCAFTHTVTFLQILEKAAEIARASDSVSMVSWCTARDHSVNMPKHLHAFRIHTKADQVKIKWHIWQIFNKLACNKIGMLHHFSLSLPPSHTLLTDTQVYPLKQAHTASFLGNPLLSLWQGVAAKIFKSLSKLETLIRLLACFPVSPPPK